MKLFGVIENTHLKNEVSGAGEMMSSLLASLVLIYSQYHLFYSILCAKYYADESKPNFEQNQSSSSPSHSKDSFRLDSRDSNSL